MFSFWSLLHNRNKNSCEDKHGALYSPFIFNKYYRDDVPPSLAHLYSNLFFDFYFYQIVWNWPDIVYKEIQEKSQYLHTRCNSAPTQCSHRGIGLQAPWTTFLLLLLTNVEPFLQAAAFIFNHLCAPFLNDEAPTNVNGACKWTIKVVFLNGHWASLFLKPLVRSTFTWSDVNVPYKASHVSVPAFLSISQRKETINETPEAQRCCNICVFSLLTKSGPGRRVLKKHEIIFHHKTETERVV